LFASQFEFLYFASHATVAFFWVRVLVYAAVGKMSQDSPFVDSPIAPTQGCVTVSSTHPDIEMCTSGAVPTVIITDAEASINDTVDVTEEDSEVLDTSSLSISLFGDNDMDVS
jgi:hypothetical protein